MLNALEDALRDHFREQINANIVLRDSQNNAITLPKSRVVLSLSEDEQEHKRVLDHSSVSSNPNRHVSPKVILPAVVISRIQLGDDGDWHFSRSVHSQRDVIITKDENAGTTSVAQFAPVQIAYSLSLYDTKAANLDRMMLNWFMLSGRTLTAFNYTHADLDNEEVEVSLAFERPQSVKPGRKEIEDDKGAVYLQTFPFRLDTLLFLPQTDAPLITTTTNKFFTYIP